ncbi:hypothetical protein C7271_16805 [filamentous cyanobacterium CCP5]|nr:hypothetical protein C7271_16805 [filamentous cyanobacterium CCP5]
MSHQPDLYRRMLEAIAQSPHQRISFADYMNLVLYDPDYGYYASQDAIIGPGGDYLTSPHLGNDFGELLAIQFAEMWEILQQPDPFDLVEMGAGQGLIAADVLGYLQQHHPDCFAALRYRIVEKSPALRAHQQQRLVHWQAKLHWHELADLPAIAGCLFSNELVDALPVHRIAKVENRLQEIYVAAEGDRLVEVTDKLSTPALAAYFDLVGVDLFAPEYPPDYATEVNLAALDWLKTVASRLERGYVLTIDYGYPASRYYSRARSQGTLQCYYRHAHHDDPYAHIGHQDITAHVDFTALENQGEACGLEKIGVTQQGLFLMALGIGDRLNQLAEIQQTDAQTLNYAIKRRQALHDLINPMGMGNFVVLAQAKGVDGTQVLKGLTVPPLTY